MDTPTKAELEHARGYVLGPDEIMETVPRLRNHPGLVDWALRWTYVDHVNDIHIRHFDQKGPNFTRALLEELDITLKVDNPEILDRYKEGAFITVSNHPFGALDGISLIDLVGHKRPDYKVMVNMVLGRISAMGPNFITVDALASDDPAKKAVSMLGIKACIQQVKGGHPLGFFPAGAVSKVNLLNGRLEDREWQASVIRLIDKLKVPVIPIFFHGSNSWFFNLLGRVSWQLRTLRLPREVWRKAHKTIHITVGEPITVEEQRAHAGSIEELGKYLKKRTYMLR